MELLEINLDCFAIIDSKYWFVEIELPLLYHFNFQEALELSE